MLKKILETPASYDEPTLLLIRAVAENNYSNALHAIKNNADINIPVTYIDSGYSLLQIAVRSFNYQLAKLLLENGADPNILSCRDESTLEVLMKSIIHEDHDKADAAKHMLDLLLCYGLNPNPAWTNGFLGMIDNLAINSEEFKSDYRKSLKKYLKNHQENSTLIELGIIEEGLPLDMAKDLLNFLTKFAKRDQENFKFKLDYYTTYQALIENTLKAANEIKEEKSNYSTSYRNEVDTALTCRWPGVLIDMVCQYTRDEIPKNVAEKRLVEKRTLSFWQPDSSPPPIIEEEEKSIRQRVNAAVREEYMLRKNK